VFHVRKTSDDSETAVDAMGDTCVPSEAFFCTGRRRAGTITIYRHISARNTNSNNSKIATTDSNIITKFNSS
jgi:hypothetical protein